MCQVELFNNDLYKKLKIPLHTAYYTERFVAYT